MFFPPPSHLSPDYPEVPSTSDHNTTFYQLIFFVIFQTTRNYIPHEDNIVIPRSRAAFWYVPFPSLPSSSLRRRCCFDKVPHKPPRPRYWLWWNTARGIMSGARGRWCRSICEASEQNPPLMARCFYFCCNDNKLINAIITSQQCYLNYEQFSLCITLSMY